MIGKDWREGTAISGRGPGRDRWNWGEKSRCQGRTLKAKGTTASTMLDHANILWICARLAKDTCQIIVVLAQLR